MESADPGDISRPREPRRAGRVCFRLFSVLLCVLCLSACGSAAPGEKQAKTAQQGKSGLPEGPYAADDRLEPTEYRTYVRGEGGVPAEGFFCDQYM